MIKNYFIVAIRNIKRNLSHSLMNVLGLSLGITCSFVLILMISHFTSFDNYHAKGDRLYRINSIREINGAADFQVGVPAPFPDAVRSDIGGLDDVLFISYQESGQISIENNGDRSLYLEESGIAYTTPDFFDHFDRKIVAGSLTSFANPNQVILSQKWANRYFGDEVALDRTLRLDNDRDLRVVAVMEDVPSNTNFPFDMIISYESIREEKLARGWNSIASDDQCFVLLAASHLPSEIESQFPALIEKHFGEGVSERVEMFLQPITELSFDSRFENFRFQTISQASIAAMGVIALFLILTACINFVNLSTAVAVRRSKEVGIRKVMGSQRGQLVFQYLSETFLITFVALAISIGLTEIGLIKVNSYFNTDLHVDLSSAWQMFTLLAIWIVISIASGAYPALLLSGFSPALALKSKISNRSIGGISMRRGLVVFQFVISQVLVVGTIIMLTQMDYFMSKDLGFKREAIITLPLQDTENVNKKKVLKSELGRIPGVSSVTLCLSPPSSGSQWMTRVAVDGVEGERLRVQEKEIDEDFLSLFDIPLIAGRELSPSDTIIGYLVNEELVRTAGISSPDEIVGKNLWWGQTALPIVGVVKDFHTTSLNNKIQPTILFSDIATSQNISLKVDPGSFNSTIKDIEEVWQAQYGEYLFTYEFLDEEIASFYEKEEKMSGLLVAFSVIAIVIGCLGLYGLISYMANEKEKEIGVRKVLGASANQIMAIFSKELLVLVGISFLIASPFAGYVMHQWLQGFEYHIDLNWTMFVGGVAVTFVIAFVTVGYRTFKAAYTNPVDTLRSE